MPPGSSPILVSSNRTTVNPCTSRDQTLAPPEEVDPEATDSCVLLR